MSDYSIFQTAGKWSKNPVTGIKLVMNRIFIGPALTNG